MIQLDNLVALHEDVAPPQLYRYNRFVSATVSSGLNKGYTIGDGLDEMDRIASETLDNSFRTALSGESKEFRESSSSLMFAMILALLMIYLVLAAQFESFKDPLVVMFTVPLAIAGALMFMSYSGITMNIFSQIGIIMLIGLVAKNGILIVEFANQRQEAGLSMAEAIRSASDPDDQCIYNPRTGSAGICNRRRGTGTYCDGYCRCRRYVGIYLPYLIHRPGNV